MRAQLVDGGVDALLQLAGDPAQRVVAQVHAEELALPAQPLVGRDRERAVDVAALEVVGRLRHRLDEHDGVAEQRRLTRLALAADRCRRDR